MSTNSSSSSSARCIVTTSSFSNTEPAGASGDEDELPVAAVAAATAVAAAVDEALGLRDDELVVLRLGELFFLAAGARLRGGGEALDAGELGGDEKTGDNCGSGW